MIKAILFDLDGTLLNRDESVKFFISNQFERLYNHLKQLSKESYTTRFIELDARGYVWKDKVYQQIVAEFPTIDISWKTLLQDYMEHFSKQCVPFLNIHHMLTTLKNSKYKLGIISNGYTSFQMNNIRALEIETYFDVISISEMEGIKKPNPEIFIRMLNKLSVEAHEAIYIRDHPQNDIVAAQNVGMKTIWKKDFQYPDFKTDNSIDDLSEIPALINQMVYYQK